MIKASHRNKACRISVESDENVEYFWIIYKFCRSVLLSSMAVRLLQLWYCNSKAYALSSRLDQADALIASDTSN